MASDPELEDEREEQKRKGGKAPEGEGQQGNSGIAARGEISFTGMVWFPIGNTIVSKCEQ